MKKNTSIMSSDVSIINFFYIKRDTFCTKKSNKMIKTTLYNHKLIHKNMNIKGRFRYDKKNIYTIINPTNTCVYLNRTFGWPKINVRKIFPEVTNVSYG